MNGHRSFSALATVERGDRTTLDRTRFSRVLDSLSGVVVKVLPSLAMMRGGAQRLVDRPVCE